MTIRTADGLSATLDEAHWQAHIVAKHPELNGNWDRVVETLQHPDGVYRSKQDRITRIYVKNFTGVLISDNPINQIDLLVHVREDRAFVLTAYFAAGKWRSLGEQIWPS